VRPEDWFTAWSRNFHHKPSKPIREI